MLNNTYFVFLFVLVLFSCNDNLKNEESIINRETAKNEIFSSLFNDVVIEKQTFQINNSRDTLLIGAEGTKVRIFANTFNTDSNATINIAIKEVFEKKDFVLANLTTTFDGRILESGGMVYINALVDGKEVTVKEDKELGVIVPTDKVDETMSVFEGVRTDSSINWIAPEKVANAEVKEMEKTFVVCWYFEEILAPYKHLISSKDFKEEDIAKRDNWFFESGRKAGDTIFFDKYYFYIDRFETNTVALSKSGSGLFIQEVITEKGTNGYINDYNTNYIFSVKKLGWSNIDKLFNEPNSEPVELIVKVDNESEFDYVYTSLIFKNRDIYIPGYQKKDNTFGFTQKDGDQLFLPMNDEVSLLTTAYKDDKSYFKLTKFKIQEKQTISCVLESKNITEIKKELEEKI